MREKFDIYALQHDVTKRIYVGRSKNVPHRIKTHLCHLKMHNHKVEDMQKDFDEYGDHFSVYILETDVEYDEWQKEYNWMMKLNSFNRETGYNYKDQCFSRIKGGIPKVAMPSTVSQSEYLKQKAMYLLSTESNVENLDFVCKFLLNERTHCIERT